ncbi:MAG: undecaprenyl-phosphate galactose phosphotransferase WbaP [Planctomycetota bacterium]|nr:undecaprenyl-phosphate galactose phosphotransferase WbaP [Planctomycetota bacterium]
MSPATSARLAQRLAQVRPVHPVAVLGAEGVAARERVRVSHACRPWLTTCTLIVSDLLSLMLSCGVAVLLRYWLDGQFTLDTYLRISPLLALFLLGYAAAKLYELPLSPTEEIRRVTMVTAAGFLALGTMTFLLRDLEAYSRAIFFVACGLSIITVLTSRVVVRAVFSPRAWWGRPTVVVGGGRSTRQVLRLLIEQSEMGLKPVGFLDDRAYRARTYAGVPCLGPVDSAAALSQANRGLTLIVACAELPREQIRRLLRAEQHMVGHMIILPDLHGLTSLGVACQDVGGALGLSVKNRLLHRRYASMKRGLELLVLVFAALPVALLTLLLAALIKLDSRGPVFYGHERIGAGGQVFKAWKFRTMAVNGDALLADLFARDPAARDEWLATQKLRDDPRITRVGNLLRKSSLDELPQFFNVLRGEMAVVGPRPIVRGELPRYGEDVELYKCVRPGITGLWQVSGRNDLSYKERVRLDAHYVRNWSMWLDLYILAKTFVVVALQRGAY